MVPNSQHWIPKAPWLLVRLNMNIEKDNIGRVMQIRETLLEIGTVGENGDIIETQTALDEAYRAVQELTAS